MFILSQGVSAPYRVLPVCLAVAGVVTSLSATAATQTLPTQVVTASRINTPQQHVLAQTQVITQEQLQRFAGQTVLEVLKSQAGISVQQSGGMGTLSNFYMRGFDNKQILVLIDGVRYGSVSAGGVAINLLPVEQIERIEIVYGASGSSIYGSDAMGGVIQIFTKGNQVQHSNASVTLGAGSQQSYLAAATGQLKTDSTSLSLSVSKSQTDGISAIKAADPTNQYDAYHPDKDGFESKNFSAVLKHQLNNHIALGYSVQGAVSETQIDNGITDKNARAEQTNGASTLFAEFGTQALTAKIQLGQSVDKSTTYAPTGLVFDSTQKQASVNVRYQHGVAQFVGGAEWLKQQLESTINYNETERSVKSVYAGYQLVGKQVDAQANVRLDDNSQYGNKVTYSGGAAYALTNSTKVGLTAATGFRAPTFNDLYYPVSKWSSPNPNLKPEESKTGELFVSHQTDISNTRATTYYNKVDNLIVLSAGKPQNLEKAEIRGVTLTSDWQLDHVIFGMQYDYQQAKNDGKTKNNGNYLLYRPQHNGSAYVGYSVPSYTIKAELQYVGKRFSDLANTNQLDNYLLLNLTGSYQLSKNLTANLRWNNVTDKDYISSYNFGTKYNALGSNAFASLTYQWF